MKQESRLAGFVDPGAVRRHFSRVAATYGSADFFSREVDRRMQERLDYVRIEPKRIVDLGCSQGASARQLQLRYPGAHVLGVDFSEPMLRASGLAAAPSWRRWLRPAKGAASPLVADATNLPLATRSTALVWSNLLLHWLDNPLPALAEAHRVLEVGGLLMFSTLGPDTLKELRAAFADGHAHSQRFTDMHDLGDMLVECGYADPVMDMEVITLTYAHLDELFRELRLAGASCAMNARRHGLTGAGRLLAARKAYEMLRHDGRLPATFEVIYGHAWKAAPKTSEDGRAIIRFASRPA